MDTYSENPCSACPRLVAGCFATPARSAPAYDKIEASPEGAKMTPHIEPNFSKEEQIAGLIDQISAYIEQFHHGSVELVEIEGDVIKVRLGGACAECELSTQTLQGWVAGTIRQFFPDAIVVAV